MTHSVCICWYNGETHMFLKRKKYKRVRWRCLAFKSPNQSFLSRDKASSFFARLDSSERAREEERFEAIRYYVRCTSRRRRAKESACSDSKNITLRKAGKARNESFFSFTESIDKTCSEVKNVWSQEKPGAVIQQASRAGKLYGRCRMKFTKSGPLRKEEEEGLSVAKKVLLQPVGGAGG